MKPISFLLNAPFNQGMTVNSVAYRLLLVYGAMPNGNGRYSQKL